MQDIALIRDLDYWESIVEKLNIFDIRVLELVYKNEVYSLNELMKELRYTFKIKKCKSSFIKNLKKLGSLGLLMIVEGHPLFINEIIPIRDNVNKLIWIMKARYRLE